ncbi:class I SAM-dependent methyltransferase [Pseudolysinimonas kribbensis]|uniref:Methyltransferase type 11 n=1 Tax=Pseudolysinimonas kribbensis TaxID=433641 RepID=A0ABQ6K7A3_9MICO|nr:methyltransferase domain-containing protein [Pseudolysinimonas kribbensis]GMA94626.1 methyltransferase type 11 [Pseudolysinimonas kribbensis]
MIRHSVVVGERREPAAFGGDPYEAALERGGGLLRVQVLTGGRADALEVGRWMRHDDVDAALVRRTCGSLLDVGCGPGRLVRAAVLAGRIALGVDVSPAAVRHAIRQGLPVLRRSVFGAVPRDGEWGAVLLADGNIGIGGDPCALLRRCGELMAPDGRIHVETHVDAGRNRRYLARLSDDTGRRGPVFPWAELGAARLAAVAAEAGLSLDEQWTRGGRSFSVLRRSAGARAA